MNPFDLAKEHVKQLTNLSNEQKLQVYALYKQSTMGDNHNDQPSAFSPTKRYKHDAWIKLKGTSLNDAQTQYIALIASLSPSFQPMQRTQGAQGAGGRGVQDPGE